MSQESGGAQPPARRLERPSVRRVVTHALLALFLLVILGYIPLLGVFLQGERISKELMGPIRTSYITFDDDGSRLNLGPPPKQLVFSDSIVDRSPHEEARLQEQFDVIRVRISVYLGIALRFFSWHYASVATAAGSGLVAAVALLLISKRGWANASPYVITVFITTSAIAGFYTTLPRVFRHRANIAECQELFLSHVALESSVLTYVATGRNAEGRHCDTKEFIRETDAAMNRLHRWPIELDPSATPMPGESLRELAESTP